MDTVSIVPKAVAALEGTMLLRELREDLATAYAAMQLGQRPVWESRARGTRATLVLDGDGVPARMLLEQRITLSGSLIDVRGRLESAGQMVFDLPKYVPIFEVDLVVT